MAASHERFDVPRLESVCHLFVCVLCVVTGLISSGASEVVTSTFLHGLTAVDLNEFAVSLCVFSVLDGSTVVLRLIIHVFYV